MRRTILWNTSFSTNESMILNRIKRLSHDKVFLFPGKVEFRDLPPKPPWRHDSGAQSRIGPQVLHTHAFPTGRSLHCNDPAQVQAGTWKDSDPVDSNPDISVPVLPASKHKSVLTFRALQQPKLHLLRLEMDHAPDPPLFEATQFAQRVLWFYGRAPSRIQRLLHRIRNPKRG